MATTRHRWTRRLQSRLEKRGYPRLQMAIILAAAGAAGFLASFALLRSDLRTMAWRYPLAASAGYIVFLLLLGLWLHYARRGATSDLGPGDVLDAADAARGWRSDAKLEPYPALELEDGTSAPGAASLDFDADEGAIVVIALAILIASVGAAFYMLYIAPVLFAELLLEGVLLTSVYRRVRRIEPEAWYSVVFRRTWKPFVGLALGLALLGYVAQSLVPDARSLGDLLGAWMPGGLR